MTPGHALRLEKCENHEVKICIDASWAGELIGDLSQVTALMCGETLSLGRAKSNLWSHGAVQN